MKQSIQRYVMHVLAVFMDRDLVACRAIWAQDDEVDALYNQVYRELLTVMLNDPTTIEQATKLLWAWLDCWD